MIQRQVIIDLDPGIGSALAATVAMLDPALDVLALTSTRGCASPEAVDRFVAGLLAAVDPPKWPRIGYAESVAEWVERPACPLTSDFELLNGKYGLGELHPQENTLHKRRDSARVITELVKAAPHDITVVTFGSLENVAASFDRLAEFGELVGGLVCLGGSVAVGGDATAAAELNVFLNPEAARRVITQSIIPQWLTLDVTRSVSISLEQAQKMITGVSPAAEVLRDLLKFAFRAQRQRHGVEGIALQEVFAVAAVAHPELFEYQRLPCDVELTGEVTRGCTVFDRRNRGLVDPEQRAGGQVQVAVKVDVQGVHDYVCRVLANA